MKSNEKQRCPGVEETVDVASRDSFPASDPPSWSATHLGAPTVVGAPEMLYDIVQHIRDDVRLLSETIGERNDRSPRAIKNLDRAANAIEARFQEAGLPVRRRPVNEAASNIEAIVRGGRLAQETVVVGAHYDSGERSPGADDNATGIAILLALAEQLKELRLERTVRLVAFAAEEPPHVGSNTMGSAVYLREIHREGPRITAMMSLEGVGVLRPERRAWPFYVSRVLSADLAIVGDRSTRYLIERVKRVFDAADTEVEVATVSFPLFFAGVRAASHLAFAREGIPAFMISDTAVLRSFDYHREADTADRLDYDRLGAASLAFREVVKSLAGVEARLAA